LKAFEFPEEYGDDKEIEGFEELRSEYEGEIKFVSYYNK
jgi:hypothetical protein